MLLKTSKQLETVTDLHKNHSFILYISSDHPDTEGDSIMKNSDSNY